MKLNGRLSEYSAITVYDLDPDATTATDVAWVDMSEWYHFRFLFIRTVGTSALTAKIFANSAANGSGTDITVKTLTLAAQPDALVDMIQGEYTADDIAAADVANGTARYVTANLTFATGTDEGVVVYERFGPRNATSGLTADIVA
jgi:hypothetical protein